MSVDIAQLGFSIESSQAEIAAARLKKLGKAANEAETASMRLAKQAEKVGSSMKKMGRNMSMYVTAPLLAAAAASVKFGTDFEHNLTKIVTLVGVSREMVGDFRKEILRLAPSLGRGPVELSDALFAVTSAGQRGAEAVNTLTQAAKASAIGLGNTRVVALASTAAVQAYGRSNMDATKAVEILIGTVEQGNLAAEDLAPVLGRAIGLASELGVAFEDMGAFIAVYTRLNVTADESATALRSALASLQKPAQDAEQAFIDMGTSLEEVRTKMAGGPGEFVETMLDLVRRSREFNVDLVNVFPNVRALAGMLGVFGGEAEVARDVVIKISKAIGTLEERLQAVKDLDPQFKFDQMTAELQTMAIGLSNDLLPAVLDIAKEIQSMSAAFRELSPETQTLIVRIGLLTAVFGPLLLILGSMVRTFAVMLPWFTALAGVITTKLLPAIRLTMIRLAGMSVAFSGLFGAAGFVVAGVAVLGLIALSMRDTEREATELDIEINDLIESMENFGKTAFDLALGKLNIVLAENDAIVQGIINNLNALITAQSIDPEAWRVDRIAMFYEQLAIAQVEGKRLQDQLDALTAAKAELDVKMAAPLPTPEAAGGGLKLTSDEIDALQELQDELLPTAKAMKELTAARKLLGKALSTKDISPELYEQLSKALERSALAMDAFADSIGTMKELDVTIMADLEKSFAFVEGLEAVEEQIKALEAVIDPTGAAMQNMADMYKELDKLFLEGHIPEDKYIELSEAIDKASASVILLDDAFQRGAQDWLNVLQGMQGLFHEDSKAAEALRTAMTALNIIMGINAVIKQLQGGDVYSAIPRALAVAALIASMGVSTDAAGSAPERTLQESQGTGSVLGDAEAKTESILNASEITADATSELVGINRGMLHALQNLQAGLGGASVQLARGAGDVDFGELPKGWDFSAIFGAGIFDLFGLNFVGNILNKIFGGSAKVLDEGVRIVGGFLNDLSSDVMVQAWQQLKVKKSIFHSSKIEDRFEELGDEVGNQFALVFASIGDTVREAALALGIPLDLIEQRMAAFEIATMTISFQDLTAEEQREELLAVFGSIFDDLAADVVPFIDQFQLVGEGLGETLVRVATSVQVFREAITAFGFTVDTIDPELFAQIAVGLIEMTGGVENFISLFTTFFDKFASEEKKLEFVTSQLTRAFESVGLEIPATRDGMFELMLSLDATTESGQRQIAMLLQIAGVADEYYSLVESSEQERLKLAQEVADAIAAQAELVRSQVDAIANFTGASGYGPLVALTKSFDEAMKAAKSLNATQKEYALITRAFDAQLKRMAAELTLSVISLMDRLFGEDAGVSGAINEGLENTREVANDVFRDWMRALEDIYEFTQELLLDENLTTLTPAEQFAESQSQFDKLLAAAMAGDAEAAAALPDAAQALLEEARFMFASGQQYTDIFNKTLAALNALSMPDNVPEFIIETDTGTGPGETISPVDELVTKLERFLLGSDLAASLRDLSQVLGVSVIALAQELGVPLRELAVVLGVELNTLSEATATGLADMSSMLGADIFELLDALGVNLMDLAVASGVHIDDMSEDLVVALGEFAKNLGVDVLLLTDKLGLSIDDLAETFGLGIAEFSAEQFKALVEFSNALGAGVADVAEALDINLGTIADATSLLSQSLDIAIAELPDNIQLELSPFLEAIRGATTDADANVAINNLGGYILGLPPEIAAGLLPFLDLIGFQPQSPELTALFGIEINTAATVAAILGLDVGGSDNFAPNISGDKEYDTVGKIGDTYIPPSDPQDPGINALTGLPWPSFATGGFVDQTGMAQLHAGEYVVNRSADNISVTTNDTLSVHELSQIRSVLSDIKEQNRQYYQDDLKVGRGIESGVTQTAEQQRRMSSG